MLIQDDREKRSEILLGFLVLAIGVAIGFLARPRLWGSALTPERAQVQPELAGAALDEQPSEVEPGLALQIPMLRKETPEPPPENDLETIYIDVPEEGAATLQGVYNRSMKSGLIVQTDGDLVDAVVRNADKTIQSKVRIKGDYLDHLNTDRWSFRVELEDNKLFGMSRFSIQHPKTRGYLWEWLIMQAARRDGLLAPRSMFVNIVLNGNSLGMYYLEEHFTKELLESQGRREGPIVRFNETAAMSSEEQYHFQQSLTPKSVAPATSINQAEITGFGEKSLNKVETQARQLQEALDQMKRLQAGIRTWLTGDTAPLAQYQARLERADAKLSDVLDTNAAAQMHALVCLFRCKHGLAWKNRRFYHNPISGRLEPVVYDTLAGDPIPERDPLAMNTYTTHEFLKSPSYYNLLFVHLARMSNPRWLNGLFEEFGDELDKYSLLMQAEGMTNVRADADAVRNQLWDQQVYLRELLRPNDAVNFDARLIGDSKRTGEMEVEVWATTRIPIAFRGFRFENGRMISAQRALDPRTRAGTSTLADESAAVILPTDSSRVVFRFPADERLAMLENVEELKRAIREQAVADQSNKLVIVAEYRLLTEQEPRMEQLSVRNFQSEWTDEGGRPAPPTLRQALKEHDFLRYDENEGRLSVEPGEWDVHGDLVVPENTILHVDPGTTLRFDQSAALITENALQFRGTAEAPIVLRPKDGVASWSGVTVLGARDPSRWDHVRVHDTNVIQRGGWIMTGGVTFYRCPVELYDSSFIDAHGEDALNIYGTEFRLERVTVDTCASDAFDGDFVTGIVTECTFKNSVEDAVDVSGSNIEVTDCRFVSIGDKAISVGENSVVRSSGCVVESASIAVASKDFSRAEIDGLVVQYAENYAFAAYIKKPEYGPCSIVADNIEIVETGLGEYLIQTPCTLVLNGDSKESVEVDVKQMYRDKILGK